MHRVTRHVRNNVVAYLALFIALGGTSYAAFELPAGSVGTAQLRNHSITPEKLDPGRIGGYVRFWAEISADGKVVASRPRAKIVVWYSHPGSIFAGGGVAWNRPIPVGCFSLATAASYPTPAYVSAITTTGRGPGTQVRLALSTPDPVNVAVICPEP